MFFTYRVEVSAHRRDTGAFIFDFAWIGAAKNKHEAELRALMAAAAVSESGGVARCRYSFAPGGTKRSLTGFSKALLGTAAFVGVAAAALVAGAPLGVWAALGGVALAGLFVLRWLCATIDEDFFGGEK